MLKEDRDNLSMKAADIHPEICDVYGANTINDEMLQKWVKAI